MVANTLNYGINAAIADREPLAAYTGNISFTTGCAVKCGVADDDIFV